MLDLLQFLEDWLAEKVRLKEGNQFLGRVSMDDIFPMLALCRAAVEMSDLAGPGWPGNCPKCMWLVTQEYGAEFAEHVEGCPREAVFAIAQEIYDNA